MMHRVLTFGSALTLGLAVGVFTVAGCTEGDSRTTGSGTGTAGTGSATGAAGTGSGAGTAGTGSATGAAGTGSATGAAGTGSATGAAGTGSATGTAGTGSATGAAGTGSVTGTAGTGSATGAAGTGGGGRPSGPSAGCQADVPNEPLGQAVSHPIDITGMDPKYVAGYTHRKYCTTIPKNYDPTKPYPVVFYGPGCGGFGCEGNSFSGRTDIFLVQATIGTAEGKDLVPSAAAPGCFQAGVVVTPDSPEGSYFDQVMAEVEKKYCIDKGRVFAAGTSSGAWLANYLACARGNVIRGTASDSGGIGFDHGTCKPGAAVMEFPGDATTKKDGPGNEIGAALARDTFIKLNGCSMTPTSMKFGNDTCDVYGGCASPVAWCNVGGGHQSGNAHLSPTGFAFWNMLQ